MGNLPVYYGYEYMMDIYITSIWKIAYNECMQLWSVHTMHNAAKRRVEHGFRQVSVRSVQVGPASHVEM